MYERCINRPLTFSCDKEYRDLVSAVVRLFALSVSVILLVYVLECSF